MHPSKSYRKTPDKENLLFADRRGFGAWVINGTSDDDDNTPVIATAPFYMVHSGSDEEASQGKLYPTVKAHLMKDNTLVQRLRDAPNGTINCTIIVSGPDGYVSPDWYELKDQVPTWNYVTVHLKGKIRLLPREDLHGVLDALSQKFENAFVQDKPIWKIDKMPAAKLKVMMDVLIPIALEISSVSGTWKVAQAKPQRSRENVATKMLHYADNKHIEVGMELASLSTLHQTPFVSATMEDIDNMMCQSKSSTLSSSKAASADTPRDNNEKIWAMFYVVFGVLLALLCRTEN